ncbi:MAG: ATP-grasp domain-containing protein [Candidatus Dormibacteria bacterium]
MPLAEALAAAIQEPAPAPSTPRSPSSLLEGAEHTGALQRGPEVDRFNELAARQESLTPEESDELYRYRLRRLQTTGRMLEVSLSRTENELRDALDRHRRRLRALRDFEEIRGALGLPVEENVDREVDNRATDRLIEMENRRPPGLIAGSSEQRPLPEGQVRVPPASFAPSPDDVPIYILAPESQPSEALSASIDAVAADGARVHLVHRPEDIPRSDPMPLVLNWGWANPLPGDVVAINRPDAVRIASDQVESLQRFGGLAPRTVLNPSSLALLGTDRAVAKRRRGSRGSGKAVIDCAGERAGRTGYDLYQEFIPSRREWRVNLLSGRVVSAYLKEPPADSPPDALRPDWTFRRTDVLPRGVVHVAREGAQRVGLDYAGMDVMEDLDTGRVLCLEANTAPGASPETLRSFYGHVQQTLRGRARRAS